MVLQADPGKAFEKATLVACIRMVSGDRGVLAVWT